MDRRQRRTREAIFKAFTELLSKKDFEQITVGEIINKADIGRATFYSHFETKTFLLKELCEELFCHIFDSMNNQHPEHRHIFDCEAPNSVFLHLFRHLQKNDNNILELLSGQNNELFLNYFKTNLLKLAESQLQSFEMRKNEKLPDDFWINHIASTFVETVKWWVETGMKESPETITEYFYLTV
ncbi:MAG: TetR/AcrR family transcriptional regulator [Clostridia bacterium]|nr:TetR/AcrR family transcriptional regulator [Clostridia bacterium]